MERMRETRTFLVGKTHGTKTIMGNNYLPHKE